MIKIILPPPLRELVHAADEIELDLAPPVTLQTALDALEKVYPVLRGTLRDQATQKRRPLIRFFACSEDYSHHPLDTVLPEPVAKGNEPLLIVGAIAGG